jgi:hypothetical protein
MTSSSTPLSSDSWLTNPRLGPWSRWIVVILEDYGTRARRARGSRPRLFTSEKRGDGESDRRRVRGYLTSAVGMWPTLAAPANFLEVR